jgi:peptide/nickel transport system permease protein
VFSRDFFVVQGVILFLAVGYVVANLVVDILYSYLDPRIRVH